MMINLEYIVGLFNSIVPVVIIVVGTLFNVLTMLVVLISSVRLANRSLSVYVIFLAIVDTLSLYIWNLDHFTNPFFGITIESSFNIYVCKLATFAQFYSLQLSAFLVCLLSVETLVDYSRAKFDDASAVYRLLQPHFNRFGTRLRAFAACAILALLLLLVNAHILIFNGIETKNGSFKCYSASSYNINDTMNLIHLIVYSIIPLFVLVVANLLLFHLIRKHKVSLNYNLQSMQLESDLKESKLNKDDVKSDEESRVPMPRTSITFSLLFIVLTAPAALMYGLLGKQLFQDTVTKLVFYFLDNLMFLNHATLFLKLYLSNKHFKLAANTFFRRSKEIINEKLDRDKDQTISI